MATFAGSINDKKRAWLEEKGYSGTINDMLLKYYNDQAGTTFLSITDAMRNLLEKSGYSGSINDMYSKFLIDNTSQDGSITDMESQFFSDSTNSFPLVPSTISSMKLWLDSSEYNNITSIAEFTLDNGAASTITIQCKQNIMPISINFISDQDENGASYNSITRVMTVETAQDPTSFPASSIASAISALSGYTSVLTGDDDDGADSISVGNNKIVTWHDKSGTGNNATQSTDGRRPLTGVHTINGRNVLSFDGGTSDRFMSISSMVCSPNTVIIVYKTSETTFSDWNGIITSRVAPNSTKVSASSANSGTTGVSGGTGMTDTSQTGVSVYLDGISYSYADFANYAAGGLSNLPMASPHVLIWTDDLSSGTQNWCIGADTFGAVGGRHWNGNIAEIIICNDALTSTQIKGINNYLKPKWGIA